jgi:hypothetical protein
MMLLLVLLLLLLLCAADAHGLQVALQLLQCGTRWRLLLQLHCCQFWRHFAPWDSNSSSCQRCLSQGQEDAAQGMLQSLVGHHLDMP